VLGGLRTSFLNRVSLAYVFLDRVSFKGVKEGFLSSVTGQLKALFLAISAISSF